MEAAPVVAMGNFSLETLSMSTPWRYVPKTQPRPITPTQGITGYREK